MSTRDQELLCNLLCVKDNRLYSMHKLHLCCWERQEEGIEDDLDLAGSVLGFLLKEDKSLASGLFLDLMNMRAQEVKVSNNPSSLSVISASPSPDFFFLSLPNLLLRLVYQQASPPQQPSPSISSVSWQCPCRKSSSVEDRVFFKPFNYLLLLFSG